MITTFLVGKGTNNVEDITAMLLNSKIFTKLSSGNRGRAWCGELIMVIKIIMIELFQDQDQNQEWLIVIKIIITNI